MDGMNRGLAVSGGGAAIAVHYGVLKVLAKSHPWWDVMGGVSSGNLVVSMLAQAHTPGQTLTQIDALGTVLSRIKGDKDIYTKPSWGALGAALSFLKHGHFYSPAPLSRIIRDNVRLRDIWTSPVECHIGVVDLNTGGYATITGESISHEAILASGSMPILWPPVVSGRRRLCDGGLREITPLNSVIRSLRDRPGNARLDVVLASPLEWKVVDWDALDPFARMARVVNILTHTIFLYDLRRALAVNKLVRYGRPGGEGKKDINIMVYAPRESVIGNALDFDPGKRKRMIELGEAAGAEPMEEEEVDVRLEQL